LVVLEAWGCGVFANDSEDVAEGFARLLTGSGRFRTAFAVLDRSHDQATIRAFGQAVGPS
jgi:uncharacterized protein (TIGR02452 family)